MSAPRIVFAVASGSYSDFGYHAIFEDRADAEAAIEADLGEHIHEIKLYPAIDRRKDAEQEAVKAHARLSEAHDERDLLRTELKLAEEQSTKQADRASRLLAKVYDLQAAMGQIQGSHPHCEKAIAEQRYDAVCDRHFDEMSQGASRG